MGERERLGGATGEPGDWSSLISSKSLTGEGVRLMLRPREKDELVDSSLDLR